MSLRQDFAKEYPIVAVLEGMGVKLIGNGNSRKACCPFHEDKNPSFSINVSDGSWNCFAGCGSGGVVELIARRDSKSADDVLEGYRLSRSKATTNGHAEKFKAIPNFNWSACVSDFDKEKQTKLAKWRGYTPKFVTQLVDRKMIGICEGHLAFPIFAAGRVIGTHQKTNSTWITRGGRGDPWVIGDHFENVIIFESQWDAFALMDAMKWFDTPGLSATCSIVITRGANRGKEIKNLFPTAGRLMVWMQNDEPDKNGNVPAETWLADIVSVLRKVCVCKPPSTFKDLNDWYRDGATANHFIDIMEKAEIWRDPNLPVIPKPLDLRRLLKIDPKNDPNCLIGNRYLCRSGSIMWVGGSGLGKSVMTIQVAIHFALGESFLGMEPKRPLSSVIMSSEDDEYDIGEVLQGVMRGMGIQDGSAQCELVMERVHVFQECKLKGLPFIGHCHEIVSELKPDLLWINPLLSYFVGNPSDPEKSAEFTGALTSMQVETGVATMLVHHTGKPKDSKTTESYSIDDYSYIGLGSSVWTNWVRAIIVLIARKQPRGVFTLKFAKRGQRIGIVNDAFEKLREIHIEHSQKGLCWIPSEFCPDESENSTGGRPSKLSWSKVSDAWDGLDKTTPELREIIRGVLSTSDKTTSRAIEKWSGVHIIKNTKDLWVKIK